ncbi:hypothetical protein A3A37_01525 [Candidatus Kaiserbacteria bacterium RIFCSPLOWO2_01_FULL_52_36]|nr:MAG: hypothetical protein A3A37_01525 [Candidatus Kaiserbacteria bacterium RIFCSPLOWO2_01_FULL_52_36]
MGFFLLSGASQTGTFGQSIQTALAASVPQEHIVMITGYNAVPEQTDGNPHMTASGAYANPDIVAARSVDLADELPFGTVIKIEQSAATSTRACGFSAAEPFIGYRVIADSMHSRKRDQIDILFDSDVSKRVGGRIINPAAVLGVCKDITIRVVGYVDIRTMPRSQTELVARVGMATLALKK